MSASGRKSVLGKAIIDYFKEHPGVPSENVIKHLESTTFSSKSILQTVSKLKLQGKLTRSACHPYLYSVAACSNKAVVVIPEDQKKTEFKDLLVLIHHKDQEFRQTFDTVAQVQECLEKLPRGDEVALYKKIECTVKKIEWDVKI